MKEPYSTDRGVVLRVVDFLEKISIHYENHLDDVIIACHILGMLGDPVAIPSLINQLKKYGEIHSTPVGENLEISEQYRINAARFPLRAVTSILIGVRGESGGGAAHRTPRQRTPRDAEVRSLHAGSNRRQKSFPSAEEDF